jgi:hypothetical protein
LVEAGDPLVAGYGRTSIMDGVKSAILGAGVAGCVQCRRNAGGSLAV